jgi:microcystin-dependent protein
MQTTPQYALRYPQGSDHPTISQDMKNLALDMDAYIVGIPVGMTCDFDYAAASIPTWALLLYGQAISRTTYPKLHTLANQASYPHGSGDGSTTFNIGDKRGRVAAGKDDMGGTAAGRITAAISGADGTALGATVGNEGVTLSTGQMPSHSHGGQTSLVSNDHAHSGDSGGRNQDHQHGDYGHSHAPYQRVMAGDGWIGPGSSWYAGAGGDPWSSHSGGGWQTSGGWYFSNTGTMSCGYVSANHGHQTNFGGVSAWHTQGIAADGSGAAHMNTQPTIIVNKLVRAI